MALIMRFSKLLPIHDEYWKFITHYNRLSVLYHFSLPPQGGFEPSLLKSKR